VFQLCLVIHYLVFMAGIETNSNFRSVLRTHFRRYPNQQVLRRSFYGCGESG
jgi:hypothetical protein